MGRIERIAANQAILVHQLAHQIYYPTYVGILSQEQMDFMLNKSYTVSAIAAAMASGQDFYLLFDDASLAVGFMAVQEKQSNAEILRIEKLYLLPTTQGKGYGRLLIEYAESLAISTQKSILELNVNRGNNAYKFYLKQGFTVAENVDIPYYGYILDDYVMQKTLSSNPSVRGQ